MTKGRHLKRKQIFTLLRQTDILATNGKTIAQAWKEEVMVDQCDYLWRKDIMIT